MKRSFSSAIRRPVVPIPPNLPVGFKFHPSDEELIGYYLAMLLQGLYSDDMPIGIVNFLEFEPWQLPGLSKIKSQEQVWYFFCQRIVYMDRNKRMYKRTTRAGHWSSTGNPTIIENFGKRSTLRFYEGSPKRKTKWIAYEYEITQTSILPNPGEFVIIKLMMNSSGEKRTKMKTNTRKQNLQKTLTSADDRSTSLDEVMTMSNCCSHEVSTDFGNQNEANTTVMSAYSIPQQCIQKDTVHDLMPTISYNSYVVPSNYGHENPKEIAVISTYEIGESSSRATSGSQNLSSVKVVQEQRYYHTRVSPYILENQEDCILSSDFGNQKVPSEVENCPTKATPSYQVPADFGNQDVGNASIVSTFSIFNQSCQMASACGMMNIASGNGHEVTSFDFEGQNRVGMSAMSSHDTGEPSSWATSSCQNHSAVTEVRDCGYFSTKVSPLVPENQVEYEQSNCLFASDLENENLPSEVEDSPLKITPYTENQLALDSTNQSCSKKSRLEDCFQNEEFNLSFLEDDHWSGPTDFDVENETNETFPEVDVGVLPELNAVYEQQCRLNPEMKTICGDPQM